MLHGFELSESLNVLVVLELNCDFGCSTNQKYELNECQIMIGS
jgi:hypothetical protein